MSDQFYRSGEWLALRLLILRRDAWRCTSCGRLALHRPNVDHVVSRTERPDLAMDPKNLRTLCQSCHSQKTAAEDGGFGNSRWIDRRGGCDEAGDPLDEDHPWND